jgi:hypothetical protein
MVFLIVATLAAGIFAGAAIYVNAGAAFLTFVMRLMALGAA